MLPDVLIPYYAFTIDTLLFIVLQILLNHHFIDKALRIIDSVFPEDILLSEKTLSRCCKIFDQTRLKLLLFFQRKDNNHRAPPDLESLTEIDILYFIMSFKGKSEYDSKSNACRLSYFYYSQECSFIKNAHFLFGTASQFRR